MGLLSQLSPMKSLFITLESTKTPRLRWRGGRYRFEGRISEIETLKQEVAGLEEQVEEAAEEGSAADDMQESMQRIHDLLKSHGDMTAREAAEAIDSALAEISDFVR
jgi:polyhydroxyalkanoate synthesis regulator phasin